MTAVAQQDFYLNLNQYSDLKRDARNHESGVKEAASQQFESLFIQQMLKEMRSAATFDDSQHSSTMEFYTDMHDKQLALTLAKSGGIGIAKVLEQQLDQQKPISKEGGTFMPLKSQAVEGLPFDSAEKFMPLNEGRAHTEFAVQVAKTSTISQPVSPASVDTDLHNQSSKTVSQILESSFSSRIQPLLNQISDIQEEFHQLQSDVDNSEVKLSALGTTQTSSSTLVDEKIHVHTGWKSSDEFVQELLPHAQNAAKQLGVKPELLVAQSALETGWGQYTMRKADGSVAFSLFGIKADDRWAGDTVQVPTHEFKNGRMQLEEAHFRAYDSIGEAMQDYADFIQNGARYQNALSKGSDDAHYAHGLQKAGYATDPAYGNKILNILQGSTLKHGLATIESNREVA